MATRIGFDRLIEPQLAEVKGLIPAAIGALLVKLEDKAEELGEDIDWTTLRLTVDLTEAPIPRAIRLRGMVRADGETIVAELVDGD